MSIAAMVVRMMRDLEEETWRGPVDLGGGLRVGSCCGAVLAESRSFICSCRFRQSDIDLGLSNFKVSIFGSLIYP